MKVKYAVKKDSNAIDTVEYVRDSKNFVWLPSCVVGSKRPVRFNRVSKERHFFDTWEQAKKYIITKSLIVVEKAKEVESIHTRFKNVLLNERTEERGMTKKYYVTFDDSINIKKFVLYPEESKDQQIHNSWANAREHLMQREFRNIENAKKQLIEAKRVYSKICTMTNG